MKLKQELTMPVDGWIVYNGSLRYKKIIRLVNRLVAEAEGLGIRLTPVKNNQLFPVFRTDGSQVLETALPLKKPAFVLFWDKDLFLAKFMEAVGYRLFNCYAAIRDCDNKAKMHLMLQGLPIPETIIGPLSYYDHQLSEVYLNEVISRLGMPLIVKEVSGSFGMQVHLCHDKEEIKRVLSMLGHRDYLFQHFVASSAGRDLRMMVLGDQVIGAMERTNSDDFRANITLGGQGRQVEPTVEQVALALAVHRRLGLDFSGIDLLYDENGEPLVCEANSNVHFLSYEQVTGINYANQLLRYILADINQ